MPEQACRKCGCTNARGCVREPGLLEEPHLILDGTPLVTCGWAEEDLCTACAPDADVLGEWLHPAAAA